jgi:hypothetical protein
LLEIQKLYKRHKSRGNSSILMGAFPVPTQLYLVQFEILRFPEGRQRYFN